MIGRQSFRFLQLSVVGELTFFLKGKTPESVERIEKERSTLRLLLCAGNLV